MKGNITKRGRGWRLKYDVPAGADGKRRTQFVTVRGGKRDAQAKLSALLASVGRGTFVEPTKLTVGVHVAARVEHWQAAGEIGARTAERYGLLLKGQIAPHLGSIAVQKLSTADVEYWHATLRSAGLAGRTIRSAHRVLGKALADGVRHGLLVRNVAGRDGQRAPKVDVPEVEIISAEQIAAVVAKLRGRAIYPKVITALFTGMRRSELLAVQWRSVDLANKILRVIAAVEETMAHGIRIKAPKSKAGTREITLPDIVVSALTEHRRKQLELRLRLGLGRLPDDALVFPGRDGGPARPSNLSSDWKSQVQTLDLPKVTFHALRHTHASALIDAGIDIVRIARRLGHSDPSVTLRTYGHVFRRCDDLSADAINKAFGAKPVPIS